MTTSAGREALEVLVERSRHPEFAALMARQAEAGLPDKPTYRDYALGLRTNLRYLEKATPQVLDGGLVLLDVGPGVGCWMLLSRELGNAVWGEDLLSGKMVDSYKPITRWWELQVRYHGFHHYVELGPDPFPYEPDFFNLIHFRGSIGAMLQSAGMEDLEPVTEQLVKLWAKHLKPGGQVYIAHNIGEVADAFAAVLPRYHEPLRLLVNNGREARLEKP